MPERTTAFDVVGHALGVGLALLLSWLILVIGLALVRPKGPVLKEALRTLPEVVRLLHRLAYDPDLPRGVRVGLWLLLAYLAIPVDPIPYFIPVLGDADEAIIVTFVVRGIARRSGLAAIRSQWPGTHDGFAPCAGWRDCASMMRRVRDECGTTEPTVAGGRSVKRVVPVMSSGGRPGRMPGWLRLNALSLVMFGAFLVFIVLQSVFGWQANNQNLVEHGARTESYLSYLGGGEFVEATFENWESEFLQMAAFVLLTAFLVQKGSPESKPLDQGPDDREPVTAASPLPVRRGGVALRVYENSLSLALFGLFVLSFVLHLFGGTAAYNDEEALHGEHPVTVLRFLTMPQFWFQSMQNWQSEFLSVGVLIVLSIVLRQRGSSQSKPVEAPHAKTGA